MIAMGDRIQTLPSGVNSDKLASSIDKDGDR